MRKKTISSHLLFGLLRQSKHNASAPILISGTNFYVKYTTTDSDDLRGMVYPCHPKLGTPQYRGVRVSVNVNVPYGEFDGFSRLVKLGEENGVQFILGKGTREKSVSSQTPYQRLIRRFQSFLYCF